MTRLLLLLLIIFIGLSMPTQAQDTLQLIDVQPWYDAQLVEQLSITYPDYLFSASDERRTDDGRIFSTPFLEAGWLSHDGSNLFFVVTFRNPDKRRDTQEMGCIYDFAIVNCVPLPRTLQLTAGAGVSWSPDGTHIALNQDWVFLNSDADLWLLDVEALVFTNITDEGIDGKLYASNPNAIRFKLDYAPVWAANGDLYFIHREILSFPFTQDIYVLRHGETTPEFFTTLTRGILPQIVLSANALAISPDGNRLVAITGGGPTQFIQSYILWLVDLNTGDVTQLLDGRDLQIGLPDWLGNAVFVSSEVAWVQDNQHLHVLSKTNLESVVDLQTYFNVDVTTGEVSALMDYNQWDSLADFMDTTGSTEIPRYGIVLPGQENWLYMTYRHTEAPAVIRSLPLMFSDSAQTLIPIQVDPPPGIHNSPRLNGQLLYEMTTAGTVLIVDQIWTFDN